MLVGARGKSASSPMTGSGTKLCCHDSDRRSYVNLQLIFGNGAVEGLTAAFYAVLQLSIPLRKLSNYIV
jgi:hypothetical protein